MKKTFEVNVFGVFRCVQVLSTGLTFGSYGHAVGDFYPDPVSYMCPLIHWAAGRCAKDDGQAGGKNCSSQLCQCLCLPSLWRSLLGRLLPFPDMSRKNRLIFPKCFTFPPELQWTAYCLKWTVPFQVKRVFCN